MALLGMAAPAETRVAGVKARRRRGCILARERERKGKEAFFLVRGCADDDGEGDGSMDGYR